MSDLLHSLKVQVIANAMQEHVDQAYAAEISLFFVGKSYVPAIINSAYWLANQVGQVSDDEDEVRATIDALASHMRDHAMKVFAACKKDRENGVQ